MKTICECWDNTPIVIQEVIGGAATRRIIKSAEKHKINPVDIINTVFDKGTTKSKATAQRITAKYIGKIGRKPTKIQGQREMRSAREYKMGVDKGGSPLDKAISSRKPGDFAKQFKLDKIKRLKKEKAQKGKDLLDSLLKH